MSKYNLSYSHLKSEYDVEELEFQTSKKRYYFLINKILGNKPDRVFVLGIEHGGLYKNVNIFIFDLIIDFKIFNNILNSKINKMFLFEFESYEDAYAFSLDMKEPNKLCYNDR